MNKFTPCCIEMQQGDFMRCYPVLYKGEKIGIVSLTAVGLYVDVCCQCEFKTPDIYRIRMKCEETEIPLGVCVPKGCKFILNRKLPSKYIKNDNVEFFAVCGENDGGYKKMIPIAKLRNMRFRVNEGLVERN